MNVMLSRFFLF